MFKFNKVSGTSLITYKNYELAFDAPLIVIRGENRSGKSLTLSTIGNILFGAPPLSPKKRQARTLLESDTRLTLEGITDGKEWSICQRPHDRSIQYDIVENGSILRPDTINAARSMISRYVPQGEDIFYATTFLSSSRPNALVGNVSSKLDVSRLEFFESFLDIEAFDRLGEYYKNKRDQSLDGKRRFQEVSARRQELIEKITDKDLLPHIKTLRARKQELEKKKEFYHKIKNQLSVYIELADQIKDTRDAVSLENDLRKISSVVLELRKLQDRHIKAVEINKDYLEKCQTFEEVSRKLKTLILRINISNKVSSSYIDREIGSHVSRLKDLKIRRAEIVDRKSILDKYKPLYDEFKNFPKHVDGRPLKTIDQEYYFCSGMVESLSGLIKSHRKECPTCGEQFNSVKLATRLKAQKQTMLRLREERDRAIIKARREDIEKKLKSVKFSSEELLSAPKKLKNIEDHINTCSNRLNILEEIARLSERLRSLKLPKMAEDPGDCSERLHEAMREEQRLRNDLSVKEKLSRLSIGVSDSEARAQLASCNRVLPMTENTLARIDDELDRVSKHHAVNDSLKKELMTIDRRLSELESLSGDVDRYTALAKAYGARGLRLVHISAVARQFESTINEYSSIIFPEPFQFDVVIEPGKCGIIATRNNGRSSEIAGTLSLSETRCFQLLSMLGCILLLPDGMRSSVAMLDEMEANMDKNTVAVYSEQFLPFFKKFVDTLVITTPLARDVLRLDDSGMVEYNVTKIRGVSRIEKVR